MVGHLNGQGITVVRVVVDLAAYPTLLINVSALSICYSSYIVTPLANYAIEVADASCKGFDEPEPMLQCLSCMCIFLGILVTGTDAVLF